MHDRDVWTQIGRRPLRHAAAGWGALGGTAGEGAPLTRGATLGPFSAGFFMFDLTWAVLCPK